MNHKANALVDRMRQVNAEVARVAEGCSDEQWTMSVVDNDSRPVGVLFYHIAVAYPFALDWVGKIVNGESLPALGRDALNTINAQHAKEQANISQAEALAYLQEVTEQVAEKLPTFTDEQLSRTAAIPLAGNQEFSGEWVVEAFSISHAESHLAAINKATLEDS